MIVPDVGKNIYRKTKIGASLESTKNIESTKNSVLENAFDSLKDHKSASGNHRLIYEGYHRIPVFNLKIT